MRSLLLLVVVSCATLEPRARPDLSPGGGGGVSLVRDWTVDLTEAQPVPGGFITRSQADARYGRLAFANTWSALNTFSAGITLSGTADLTLGANVDLVLGNASTSAVRGGSAGSLRMDNGIGSKLVWDISTLTLDGTGLQVVATNSAFTGNQSTTGSVGAGTYLRSTGVAAASLPTCNGGAEGTLEQATDLDRLMSCNGTAWRGVVTEGTLGGFQSLTTAAAHSVFDADVVTRLAFVGFAWTLSAAGTTATAQTFTLRVRDSTNSITLCESAAIACDSGNSVRTLCNSGSENMTTSARIQVEVRAASCDTAPVGNLAALYH